MGALRRVASVRTFEALQQREFRLLWLGLTTSGVGQWMQQLALGWLVVQLAVGDGVPDLAPLYIGLVGLANAVPGIGFGLFAGVIADRMDRRTLLLFAQGSGMTVAAAIAVLVATERATIQSVLALTALGAMGYSFDLPSRQAILPRIVRGPQLMSAIGLNNTALSAAQLFGPLLGGVLIVPLGVAGLMAINAVTYAVAVVMLLLLRPLPPLAPVASRMLPALRDGIAYVYRDPALRWVLGMSVLMSLLARPFGLLLPAVAHDSLHVGAVELSWLLAANGLGTLSGSLLSASLGRAQARGTLLIATVIGLGLTLALFAAQRVLLAAVLTVVLPGLCLFTFSGLAYSIVQTRPPDELRGRVISLYVLTFTGLMPLGSLVLGSVGALIGIGDALLIGGVLDALLGVAALVWARPLRDPERT